MPGRFRKAGQPGLDESTSRSKGPHRLIRPRGPEGPYLRLGKPSSRLQTATGCSPRRTGVRQARRALLIGPDTSVSGSEVESGSFGCLVRGLSRGDP
jgi:hypothetical protein